MDFMEIIHVIVPIVVGAVIGYCTNFIAIKMLFRPYKEIRIGGKKLPFTPGIIPKNQSRMATAVGRTVSQQLFTSGDLTENLRNGSTLSELSNKITDSIFTSEMTISSISDKDELSQTELGIKISKGLSAKAVKRLSETDMNPIIKPAVREILAEYLKNPMVSMLLNEKLLSAIDEKIEDGLKSYIEKSGQETLEKYISEQMDHIAEKTLKDTVTEFSFDRETISQGVQNMLEKVIDKFAVSVAESIDIQKIVTSKIEAMEVEQLEELLMSIMKNELQAVINLGALLGAIIGVINIFI